MSDKSNEVSANPVQVEFPRDEYRITTSLRAEGLRAAGRVLSDKDKLKVLVQTCDIIKAHAIARFKKTREMQADALEARAREAEEASVREEQARVAKVADLTAQLAELKGEGEKEAE